MAVLMVSLDVLMASLDVRFAFVSVGCASSLALPSAPSLSTVAS